MSDTLALLETLIRCESLTPRDAGCLDLIAARLTPLGFIDERLNFGDTENSWLRRGEAKPLFVFLGHTDVVPVGKNFLIRHLAENFSPFWFSISIT